MSMGYFSKIDVSPFWQARFPAAKSGIETQRSTKTRDRKQAEAILAAWALQAHLERQPGWLGSLPRRRELRVANPSRMTATTNEERAERYFAMARQAHRIYRHICREFRGFEWATGFPVILLSDLMPPAGALQGMKIAPLISNDLCPFSGQM
jgi:hypothetical protein